METWTAPTAPTASMLIKGGHCFMLVARCKRRTCSKWIRPFSVNPDFHHYYKSPPSPFWATTSKNSMVAFCIYNKSIFFHESWVYVSFKNGTKYHFDPLPISTIVFRSNRVWHIHVLHIRVQRMNTTIYVFVVNPFKHFYEFLCVRLL